MQSNTIYQWSVLLVISYFQYFINIMLEKNNIQQQQNSNQSDVCMGYFNQF